MTARIPLPPYPTGWFCIAFAREVGRRPQRVRWLGRTLELRRGPEGITVQALDGRPTPEIRHLHGATLGWFDLHDGSPAYELPEADDTGWTAYASHRWQDLHTHPQETTENSVDVAHFSLVHGYTDVAVERDAEIDGPSLRARYSFTRGAGVLGVDLTTFRAIIDVLALGLGYSFVENHVPVIGLHTRQLVLATPTEAGRLTLRIGGSIRIGPLGGAAALVARDLMMTGFALDVSRDLEIWQTKRYLARPCVVSGDGPIRRYRVWCRQFYPEAA